MRFVSDRPNVVVWHPTKQRMLTQFKDNVLETNDKFIINRLLELGYKPVQRLEDMTVAQLRKMAVGTVSIPQGAKKTDIIRILEGENDV